MKKKEKENQEEFMCCPCMFSVYKKYKKTSDKVK